MRPKLKGDTFYIPIPDGVYIRNNQKTFKIKGKVVYRWLERLAPYLDGQYTLEEITTGLSAEKQAMIDDLISLLSHNGFIKDVSSDRSHTLSKAEERLYANEIAFIDSFVDSAAYRFEQFRECNMLLIGSGLTFTALVRAGLRAGVRQLSVCQSEESSSDWHHYHDYLQRQNQQGARQELQPVVAPAWEDEESVAAFLLGFDAVISVSDRPQLNQARLLNHLCKAQKKPFIQALVIDDHAWIGPLIYPESDGCWECGWHRLLTNLPNPAEQLAHYLWPQASSRFIALPTAAVVANTLVFELFKHLTGIQHLETAKRMLVIDLETLQTESHPFLPHPYCQSCNPSALSRSPMHEIMRELEQGEPIDLEAFSQQMAACFDNQLGLLSSLTEENFVQMPLNISRATISNPALLSIGGYQHAHGWPVANNEKIVAVPSPGKTGCVNDAMLKTLQEPLTTIGVGPSVHIARQRATLRGCELYAASVIEHRYLLKLEGSKVTQPAVQAEWLTTTLLPEENDLWVWAWDLCQEHACLVPALLVYPGLQGLVPGEKTTLGLASGLTWSQAVSRALLKLCKELTLLHIPSAREPFPHIDLMALPLDDEGARYRHMLELTKTLPQVYDVTGPLGVPTFAFCLDTTTITYATHLSPFKAIRTGLEQVVQQYQAQVNRQPAYALPAVPTLPAKLQGHELQSLTYQNSLDPSVEQSYLQRILVEQGWQPIVVPLHGDPVLTHIMPYIVHALLARIPS
ncbi:MAG TPA: TOMM precursor leader peptide-binding protein [Ktedonobacteraceae bacterium]|nr:TOMM precursor leader peptide-binding protein [Ktedonobacteraceae bacterium]